MDELKSQFCLQSTRSHPHVIAHIALQYNNHACTLRNAEKEEERKTTYSIATIPDIWCWWWMAVEYSVVITLFEKTHRDKKDKHSQHTQQQQKWTVDWNRNGNTTLFFVCPPSSFTSSLLIQRQHNEGLVAIISNSQRFEFSSDEFFYHLSNILCVCVCNAHSSYQDFCAFQFCVTHAIFEASK